MGLGGMCPALLATTAAYPPSRRDRPDGAAEPGWLGRGPERHAPRHALAGRWPSADQRLRVPAPEDQRGPAAVRPRYPAPGLGVVGRAVSVRGGLPLLGCARRGRPRPRTRHA